MQKTKRPATYIEDIKAFRSSFASTLTKFEYLPLPPPNPLETHQPADPHSTRSKTSYSTKSRTPRESPWSSR